MVLVQDGGTYRSTNAVFWEFTGVGPHAMRCNGFLLRGLFALAHVHWKSACAHGATPSVTSPEDLKLFALAAGAKHLDTFRAAVNRRIEEGTFKPGQRGALPQEMLLVAAITAELDADVIIETGRARGDSALMILSALQEIQRARGRPMVEFHSVEWTKARWHIPSDNRLALQRLKLFSNVSLHDGDATRVLPKLLPRLRSKRVVLFTDGPKGYAGQALHREAIRMPHVVAQFIHDANFGFDVRAHIENLITGKARDMNRDAWPCGSEAFFSDDPAWQRANRQLDIEFIADHKRLGHAYTVYTTRPPCCLYSAPTPCFGDHINTTDAIALIVRRDDAHSCLNLNTTLPAPRCMGRSSGCLDIKCVPRFRASG
jgi:hypothetical protein